MSMPWLEMHESSGSRAPSAMNVPRMSRLIRTTSGGLPAATVGRNVAGSKSASVNESFTSGYFSANVLTRVYPISSATPSLPSSGLHGAGEHPILAPTSRSPLISTAAGVPAGVAPAPEDGPAPVVAPAPGLELVPGPHAAASRATVTRSAGGRERDDIAFLQIPGPAVRPGFRRLGAHPAIVIPAGVGRVHGGRRRVATTLQIRAPVAESAKTDCARGSVVGCSTH